MARYINRRCDEAALEICPYRESGNGDGPMHDFIKQIASLSLFGKCVAAVVGILLIHAVFHVLERALPRRFDCGLCLATMTFDS